MRRGGPSLPLARSGGLPRPWLLALLWLVSSALPSVVSAEPSDAVRQQTMKAVFVYKFTLYVTWPDRVAVAPMRIGLLGDSPLQGPLEEVARTKQARGQAISVTRYGSVEEARDCHVLVVPAAWTPRIHEIVAGLKGRPVLTVGDGGGMARAGLHLGFVIQDGRLRFEANPEALTRASLSASSRLLKLAIRVGDDRSHVLEETTESAD